MGRRKVEVVSLGKAFHTENRPPGTDHAACHQRNWLGRHESGEVVSSTALFHLQCGVQTRVSKPGCRLLSCLPLPADTDTGEEPDMVASILPALSVSDFTASSAQYPEITLLRAQIEKGWPKCKKDVDSALAPYCLIRHELSASDALVIRGEHHYIVPVFLWATVVH